MRAPELLPASPPAAASLPTTSSSNLDMLHPSSPLSLRKSEGAELIGDVANMLKAFIGLNVMYTAYAFSKAGLLRGVIGLFFITAVTEHCCLLLVDVKNAMPASFVCSGSPDLSGKPTPTFADIARFAGGPGMEAFVNSALVLTQFGYCVGYLIFMSQTIHDLFRTSDAVWPFILIPLPMLIALSLLSSIRSLSPFSIIANFALLTGFIAVVSYIGKHFQWAPSSPPLSSFPLFFGQMTAALEGIGLVIPVETSMVNKSRFPLVLRASLSIMATVLMVVGVLGFATFGAGTRSILLLNFGKSPVVDIVKLVLIIGILFTYPLQLIPVIAATESWIFSGTQASTSGFRSQLLNDELAILNGSLTADDSDDDAENMAAGSSSPDSSLYERESATREQIESADASSANSPFVSDPKRVCARIIIVLATAITGMFAGASFGLFQSLIGSLGASSLAYTVPSLLHVRIFGDQISAGARAKDWAISLFGITGTIVGTATAVWEISRVHAGAAVTFP
jgi:solute carrier family 36 (proton-coupled amino acid transporter)